MRAGRLDRRITIQRKAVTQAPSGEPIETWAALSHRRPARRHDMRGDERFTASQFVARQQVSFDIRYADSVADVNPLDRVLFPPPSDADDQNPPVDTIYDVMSVEEIGRREGLRIRAARRAEGGG